MKDLSFEIANKLISEIYPFHLDFVQNFEDQIDFEWLSRNRNIKWSVNFISEFYGRWNWEALEENRSVFDNLTLGLFFPNKVDLPKCTCSRKESFCEYLECSVNYNKIRFSKSLYTERPDSYMQLDLMCNSGFIDEDMIKKFYKSQDVKYLTSIKFL